MATTEDVSILRVDTGEAVKSVNDLKENVKVLKKNLGELEIGSEEYQSTLKELAINQNALKDAMHASSASMEEVSASAKGVSQSYNSLVHSMAALKEEWRATNDEARRNELGKQIAEVNQQLKDMDASVGNFQRNVGNYESGFKGVAAVFDKWGSTLKSLPPTLGPVKESIGKVGESMQLVGKQPILGIIGLLAPIIMKITSALKGNQTAMDAVKKVMASLQPVFDIVQGVMDKLAQGISKVADWFVELMKKSSGSLATIVSGAFGVGNAILQFLLTPIRTAINAFKDLSQVVKNVFSGDWSKAWESAKTAASKIGESFKQGFSFKANFEEGKNIGKQFLEGLNSLDKDAEKKGKSSGKSYAKGVKKGVEDALKDIDLEDISIEDVDIGLGKYDDKKAAEQLKQIDKVAERRKKLNSALVDDAREKEEKEYQIMAEANQRKLDLLKQFSQEAFDAMDTDAHIAYEKQIADLEVQIADDARIRKKKINEQEVADKKSTQDQLSQIAMAAASATSQILSGIADMYEQDGVTSKKEAKKIKQLRIASATIDMIQGAVTAYATAQLLGPIAGPIVGGINAAAVTTLGMMNIAKIKSTNFEGSSEGGGASVTPAAVPAPNIPTQLDSVRNVTTASEEERLNQMASPQKVYILQSDIEAAGNQSKVQVSESSF